MPGHQRFVILAENYQQFVTLDRPRTEARQQRHRISSSLTLSPSCLHMSLAHSCTIPIAVICVDWKRTAGSPLHLHFRAAHHCRGLHVTCQCSNENHSSLSLMATEQREEKKHSREEITDMNHHNALRRLPMNRNRRRWPLATSRRRLWCL